MTQTPFHSTRRPSTSMTRLTRANALQTQVARSRAVLAHLGVLDPLALLSWPFGARAVAHRWHQSTNTAQACNLCYCRGNQVPGVGVRVGGFRVRWRFWCSLCWAFHLKRLRHHAKPWKPPRTNSPCACTCLSACTQRWTRRRQWR